MGRTATPDQALRQLSWSVAQRVRYLMQEWLPLSIIAETLAREMLTYDIGAPRTSPPAFVFCAQRHWEKAQ